MYEDWQLTAEQSNILVRAGDISAVLRAADDADWDLDDHEIKFNERFDPFADDPE
jgi:hypothetical protein